MKNTTTQCCQCKIFLTLKKQKNSKTIKSYEKRIGSLFHVSLVLSCPIQDTAPHLQIQPNPNTTSSTGKEESGSLQTDC